MNDKTQLAGPRRAHLRAMRWPGAVAAATVLLVLASACSGSTPSTTTPTSPSQAGGLAGFPRAETLYTSGTAYAPPSNWNPFNLGQLRHGHAGTDL